MFTAVSPSTAKKYSVLFHVSCEKYNNPRFREDLASTGAIYKRTFVGRMGLDIEVVEIDANDEILLSLYKLYPEIKENAIIFQ